MWAGLHPPLQSLLLFETMATEYSRRKALQIGLAGAGALCGYRVAPPDRSGRLRARPGPASDTLAPGLGVLGLQAGRDGLVFVPEGHTPGEPVPLVVLFHGAGGSGRGILQRFQPLLPELALAVLAPDSRGSTWDVRQGGFGDDVAFIDRALERFFTKVTVDPARIIAAGFSDGASYALSLGLTNGDLFTRIVAFSPGFMAPGKRVGRPPIFVSHGTGDDILPIDVTSRRLVPQLRRLGYAVDYREFDGGHTVKPELALEALQTR